MAENLHFSSVNVMKAADELTAKQNAINQISDKMEEIIAKANGAWQGEIASDMLAILGENAKLTASVSQQIGSYSASLHQANGNYEKADIHNSSLTESMQKEFTV